jgi:hypothetical protein
MKPAPPVISTHASCPFVRTSRLERTPRDSSTVVAQAGWSGSDRSRRTRARNGTVGRLDAASAGCAGIGTG